MVQPRAENWHRTEPCVTARDENAEAAIPKAVAQCSRSADSSSARSWSLAMTSASESLLDASSIRVPQPFTLSKTSVTLSAAEVLRADSEAASLQVAKGVSPSRESKKRHSRPPVSNIARSECSRSPWSACAVERLSSLASKVGSSTGGTTCERIRPVASSSSRSAS